LIFGGLVFLQPLFWLSLSLVVLGAILGTYPGHRLQGYLVRVKKKNRAAQQVFSDATKQEGSELQHLGHLERVGKRSTQLGTKGKERARKSKLNSRFQLILQFISGKFLILQTIVFFRLFLLTALVFLALIVFQQQRVLLSNFGISLSGSKNPQHGGVLVISWLRELIVLPEFYTYASILLILGFVWALFSFLVRFFFFTAYLVMLILVVQSFGSFSLGDPLEVYYLTPSPSRSLVVLPVDQINTNDPSPRSFGRIFFEGFQLPYWSIGLGLPPLLVRSYRIDFGEPVAISDNTPQADQANSPRGTTRSFFLDQASFPRPLVGSLSSFGLDVLDLANSLSLSLPFARRSGFLAQFDQPGALVIFDQGLFSLVFKPGIR
jgi:hypothetical protein